jgi:hypothetical protein
MKTGDNIRNHYGVTTNESGGCCYDIRELWQIIDLEYRTLTPFINQQMQCLILAVQDFECSAQDQLAKDIFKCTVYTISGNISGRLTNLSAIFEHCVHYLQIHNYIRNNNDGHNNNNQQYATVNTDEYSHFRHNFKRKNRVTINEINDYYYGTLKAERNFCAHEIFPCIPMLNKLIEIDEKFEPLYSLMEKIYYKVVTTFERKHYQNKFFQAIHTDVQKVINNNQGLRRLINTY